MLVAISDTHGRDDARLSGQTEAAVEAADVVVHAGDFVTANVLDAFESHGSIAAVYGNADAAAVRDRLPADRTLEWQDLRIAVVHGHEHSDIALELFARQSNADLVVRGHTHRPQFVDDEVPVLNPGSHADPRWNRPAHAELEWDDSAGLARGRLVEPTGAVFDRFVVEPRAGR